MNKHYPWGIESPSDRKKRLIKLLTRNGEQLSRKLTRSEVILQIRIVEEYQQYKKNRHHGHESQVTTVESKIYVLTNEIGSIKYVGKTIAPLQDRLRGHVLKAKIGSYVNVSVWIRSLLKENKRPQISLVESIKPGDDWAKAERKWIAFFQLLDDKLLNMTDGGEGVTGHHHNEETRARLSKTTKKFMRETSQRQISSLRVVGRKLSVPDLPNIGNKYQSGEVTQRELAKEHGTSQSTISRALRNKTFASFEIADFDIPRMIEACKMKRRMLRDGTLVKKIILRYIEGNGKLSLEAIGRENGVSAHCISDIICGKTYKDLIPTELRDQAKFVANDRHRTSNRRVLTFHIAELIRSKYLTGGFSLNALAKEFGVCKKSILNIIHNRTYTK